MQESVLTASRVLMGDSLAFHIIFVSFGLTLPILVSWFEWSGIRKNDQRLINIARFWSKIMALLVITGVISGTIIALQMSLVWPGILKFGGEVIGLPFMFETYAFLLEAVFLALYMATWNNKKVSPTLHAIIGLFVILGSTASAYAITSVNGWMNLPTGFTIVKGKFENIDVLQAMFSQTAIIEFIHSMPAYYFAVSLTIAGLYSIRLLRAKAKDRLGKKHELDRLIIKRLMIFASIMFVAIAITADITGKYLAKHEPVKLAAIELIYETGDNLPMIIGGIDNGNGEIVGPHFKIPSALSILAGNSPNTELKGLNEFPKDEQPPLYIHTLFSIKLMLVGVLALLIGLYWFAVLRKKDWMSRPWLLLYMLVSGFIAFTIIELGWMLTEIGRQPWAVRGYLKTADAVTKTNDVSSFGYIFPIAFVLLFIVTIMAVKKIIDVETRKGSNPK